MGKRVSVPCTYPTPDEDGRLPEGWEEGRTAERCYHDSCIEVENWRLQYEAFERPYRESLELARADVDGEGLDEQALMGRIQRRLK